MERGPAGEVRGIAVHTGARVAALAGAGEILVSRTIRDLVAGAPVRLESRGTHELKGVPGSWRYSRPAAEASRTGGCGGREGARGPSAQ